MAVLQDSPNAAKAALLKLGLVLPCFSEVNPFLLSSAMGIAVAPTLLYVEADGTVTLTSEAFRRPDIEDFALRLGAPKPVLAGDTMPSFKPG